MVFSQQVNIVYEFQKTCFLSCLLEIAFRKRNLASPIFPSDPAPQSMIPVKIEPRVFFWHVHTSNKPSRLIIEYKSLTGAMFGFHVMLWLRAARNASKSAFF